MPVATAAVKPTRMSVRRLNINHLHRTLGKYAFALADRLPGLIFIVWIFADYRVGREK